MENEKPLEKYTVKELKAMALEMEEITGGSAMKKDELIDAIKKAKGIPVKKVKEKSVESVVELKKMIKELKSKMGELRASGNRSRTDFLRKRISRLKKKTRRLAGKTA
ncbi:MAG: Rho termination factor N-terminal domain-containing protein [Proteobacteria bacterium]|nr:Rho termination factor N-terminal domain-containing protein [Pseudomonadota bacterium]